MSADHEPVSNGRKLPLKGSFAPAEPERVDILRLLDELEALPNKAIHIPRLRTLIRFDREQFDFLILKIRANLPDDLRKAQNVVRDSERIFDEARTQATYAIETGRTEAQVIVDSAQTDGNRIVEQARLQAAHMIEQTEVHRLATAQAQDMLRQAEAEAMTIRKGADDYARDVLAHIEKVLEKASGAVQQGRESFERART